MNDKEKINMDGSNSFLPNVQVEMLDQQDAVKLQIEGIQKGFPTAMILSWCMIGLFLLYKTIQILFFEIPRHIPVKHQIESVMFFQTRANFSQALKGHEKLMTQYPAYAKSYFFEIAQCYLACSGVDYNFKKGLELLVNKRLSQKQFNTLTRVVPDSLYELFVSLFSVYEKVKTGERVYVFEHKNLGLQ